jgi:uncharacterized protein
MDELTRLKVEATAFRGLVQHLQKRSDVQNIDLMNLAGFCRNCLWKWYRAAAEHYGAPVTAETAQEVVYGMPLAEWKSKFQKPATPAQEKAYDEGKSQHAKITVVE